MSKWFFRLLLYTQGIIDCFVFIKLYNKHNTNDREEKKVKEIVCWTSEAFLKKKKWFLNVYMAA